MQAHLSEDPLSDTLVLEGQMVLTFTVLDKIPPQKTLADWDRENADVLQGLLVLDEGPKAVEEGGEPIGQEIVRLERKLDLALYLLARVLSEHRATSEASAVRLSERGLQWVNSNPSAIGTVGMVELYPTTRYPLPLRICGQVVETPSDSGLSRDHCTVSFLGMEEATRESLAKLIFRAHRRRIGRQREGQG